MTSIDNLLIQWNDDPDIRNNVCYYRTYPEQPAIRKPFPPGLDRQLTKALSKIGIEDLYVHQSQAWEFSQTGKNIGLVTNTASGKSLSYNLPIINELLHNDDACALYLFPTKALARDQFDKLQQINRTLIEEGGKPFRANVYDGDTPHHARKQIRENANIILSNPDMLHYSILPNHPQWKRFLSKLRYIVIDEAHIYRGVFGSHVANIFRRLERITRFYGHSYQVFLTSATIGNPKEFFSSLIGAPVTIINQDGSPKSAKHFLIYNPPVTNALLGIRASIKSECLKLTDSFFRSNIQTIVFTRSRHFAEVLLREHLDKHNGRETDSTTYRSGLLSSERRAIEKSLRQKEIKLVFSTNALELGIDIGDLSATVLAGYPGTIASVFQMSGRSGRGNASSVTVLITGSTPLEQYIARNPAFIFEKPPECALINPNNLAVMLNHIECALNEIPFSTNERFGNLAAETLEDILQYEAENHTAIKIKENYYWTGKNQPAREISLRSATQNNYTLQVQKETGSSTIGLLDDKSAFLLAHPGAIYLHNGDQYYVEDLDIVEKIARLKPSLANYYTRPISNSEISIVDTHKSGMGTGCTKFLGELNVSKIVSGFKKIDWETGTILGTTALDLPAYTYLTTGYWFSLSKEAETDLLRQGIWNNAPIDYGPNWQKQRQLALTRDKATCQVCGQKSDANHALHIHHKIPFRHFRSFVEANDLSNLITLCSRCHRSAEQSVKMRSGLAGITHALRNLVPLFLMCDYQDMESGMMPTQEPGAGAMSIVLYERIPGGIGFSEKLYEMHTDLLSRAHQLISTCTCIDGCPSCVGPGGEFGSGGKNQAIAILERLL